jgi:hypothetical protein
MSSQADELSIFADNMHAESMKSADEWAFSHRNRQIQASVHVQKKVHTFSHLLGGFVGESNSQNAVRVDAAFDEVEDPVNNCLCLSGSRASQNEEGAIQGLNSFSLFKV